MIAHFFGAQNFSDSVFPQANFFDLNEVAADDRHKGGFAHGFGDSGVEFACFIAVFAICGDRTKSAQSNGGIDFFQNPLDDLANFSSNFVSAGLRFLQTLAVVFEFVVSMDQRLCRDFFPICRKENMQALLFAALRFLAIFEGQEYGDAARAVVALLFLGRPFFAPTPPLLRWAIVFCQRKNRLFAMKAENAAAVDFQNAGRLALDFDVNPLQFLAQKQAGLG